MSRETSEAGNFFASIASAAHAASIADEEAKATTKKSGPRAGRGLL